MRNKRLFKGFVFGLLAFTLAFCFVPTKNNFASADTTISLSTRYVEDNTVNLNHIPERIDITALLVGDDGYQGSNIEWILNGAVVDSAVSRNNTTNSSTLMFYKSQIETLEEETEWAFTARVSTETTVNASLTISFVFGQIVPLKIELMDEQSDTQQYSTTMAPFIFEASGLENYTGIEWYEQTGENKFVKIEDATNTTYSFIPLKPGTRTVLAKVGQYYSLPKTVYVTYVPFFELSFDVTQLTNNASGLNKYQFVIDGLSSIENDVDNINWYIQGYTNPVQYGGLIFEFQPTSYAYYRIVARYEGDYGEHISSEPYLIEIKIDRTAEILIVTLSVFLVMSVFLVIGIVRRVKKEKVW